MGDEFLSLSKEFWLSKDSSKVCHKCGKKFSVLRRRHHCRYCGLIFCYKCLKTNLKLNSDTKLLSICDICIDLIKNTTGDTKTTNLSIVSSSSLNEDLYESIEIDENILEFSSELLANKDPAIELCASLFINTRCEELVKEYALGHEWVHIIVSTVCKIVETVCPSAKIRGDSMNINNYITKALFVSDEAFCEFFQGAVILKSIAHKKMPKIVENPKILFLDNCEYAKELIAMNILISEQSDINKLFVKKVVSTGSNVLVCSNMLCESIIAKLMKKNILAILNLNYKDFNHISRITGGCALKSINQACQLEGILGRCRKIECRVVNDQSYIYFTETKDCTLGGCLVVQGPNPKPVSKMIRKLLIDYRNAKLERVFLIECGAVWDPKILLNYYSNELKFKQILTCKNNICINHPFASKQFYQLGDTTLGQYLINITQNAETNCSECGNANKDHSIYYIGGEKIIKVYVFKAKKINNADIFLSTSCRDCHRCISAHYLSNASWEYSFHKFLSNFSVKGSGKAKCGHEIFNNSFKFQIGEIQVLFQSESFKSFELIFPNNIQINQKFYNDLLSETLKETQISSKCVLDNILDRAKKFVVRANEEMANVNSCYSQWLFIRERLFKLIESIYKLMKEVFEPDRSMFKSYLYVETIRKRFFLECCDFKLKLLSVEASMEKIKPIKKTGGLFSSTLELYYTDLDVDKDEDLISYFHKLKQGNLTFPMCHLWFVPIYESDIGSVIAYGLSTYIYHEEARLNFPDNPEPLLSISESSEWTMQTSSHEGILSQPDITRNLYGDNIQISFTIFYPLQFSILRFNIGISDENFILSLSKTIQKLEDVGKSGAVFLKTHDHSYIIKVVDEKDFKMFLNLAPNYFSHVRKSVFHEMPSILNICLGAYKINIKNISTGKSRTDWCLVFENIGSQLSGPTIVYDLKGTTNKKRRVKGGDKRTKMDLNFIEDFASIPLPISQKDSERLEASILNDSLFLSQQNIVDYSILLVISLKEMKISLCIIDYIQQYTLEKAIENKYKTVVSTQVPTITHPDQYKARLREQIFSRYFMTIE